MPEMTAQEDSRLPAYMRLRDRLAARIAAGEWQAEQALPSENALTRDSGLSVGTVRKAIQQLVDEGLLERRQGAGTFLRKPAFDSSLFRFFALRDGGDSPSIPASRLLSRARVTAPDPVAAILGTSDVLRIERLRLFADEPLLSEEIWLPYAPFAGFESDPEAAIGPLLYPYFLDRFGQFIARAVDEVSFGTAKGTTATRLGLPEGAPIARIERTAFALDGTVLEWRETSGPAERFRYRSQIG
ncbi:GntR family transcriptional regulator [Pseudooceanicola sp. CBS1P-1]|uniref:UTRA domain-containing protein n=1 Tax=Pseudooceanicola albus TaxID=2692189 RepID=A0A6L7GAE6_9RHOB|nr:MULTISPECIES: GntR family transcriptional regulator [Pseudooceanicola]MBT9386297.1 GntR family transcriptional regulator [Pseudooceanicola endophyticus]MXN20346.1 UTRA domain-containing protein [Pseudooceanicola albus]